MQSFEKQSLIIILGPTAVGKTEISLRLAEIFTGEIISADSRLFYRGMDIGTAKPTKEEMNKIPHHLVNVAKPDEVWSLPMFLEAAYQAIDEIHQRGKIPFLVGGTGQYIRAIVEGWEIPRTHPNSHFRAVFTSLAEEIGPVNLHKRLSDLDPEAASRIDPNNVRRTIRAFEVIFSTGRRFSDQRRKSHPRYRMLILGIRRTRSDLYRRIDSRIKKMVEDGFVEEVERLLEMNYPPDLPSLSAIGYGQIIQHLKGEILLDEAVLQIKKATRQFVRKQSNWFKEENEEINWLDASDNLLEESVLKIENFLK
jgi:tRNA dimethylallyltransferase